MTPHPTCTHLILSLPSLPSFMCAHTQGNHSLSSSHKLTPPLLPHSFLPLCRENRTKYFTGFSSDLKLLTYNQTKIFHFDNGTSGSGLNETDLICTINVPLIVSLTST